MNKLQLEQALIKGVETIEALIEEDMDKIHETFKEAFQSHDGEGKFEFKLGATVKVEPCDPPRIKPAISYGVTYRTSTELKMGDENTPDLFSVPDPNEP